jgi:iron complex outermembrane receptor protein
MNVRASFHFLFPSLRRRRLARSVATLLSAGAILSAAHAQTDDLTQLTLEELDALSISAASKRAQPVFETPAAVSVLLPVDIRRTGHSSIAESLRLIPGVHVIDQLPGRNAVGIRGGNGLQSTKLLVLVDGRSVYNPFYGTVEWPNADVQLDDLARVEVVRGPGSTLWGANAVNGVINVISKDAHNTQGGVISVRGGSAEPLQGHVRYGGTAGKNTAFRVYATGADTALAAGPLSDDPMTGYKYARAGFRTDSTVGDRFNLTWQGEHFRSVRTILDDPSRAQTTSLLGRLSAKDIAGGELQLQLYADNFRNRSALRDLPADGAFPFSLNEDTSNFDLDLTHHFHVGENHDIIWGGGARFTSNQVDASAALSLIEPKNKSWLFNFFAQDEITLVPKKIRLTVGSKFEHHETIGDEVQPGIRLAWTPTHQHTLWSAYSRSVRAPSRAEREVLITLARIPATVFTPAFRADVSGNPVFGAEINNAYEIGWRWRPSHRFQTDLTAYHFAYSHVRNLRETTTVEPGPPPTVVQRYTIINDSDASTHGIEFSTQWRATDRWEMNAGVARGDSHTAADMTSPFITPDYAIPTWLWHVGSWWQLPEDLEFSTTLYGTGENKLASLPGYLRMDAQLSWHPRPDVELTLGVQNAGDPRHPESITGTATPFVEVRRNVFARIQWRF